MANRHHPDKTRHPADYPRPRGHAGAHHRCILLTTVIYNTVIYRKAPKLAIGFFRFGAWVSPGINPPGIYTGTRRPGTK